MTEAESVIAALRTEYDTVAAIASRLDGDGLTQPSGAGDWTVADVLSHLGSGSEINLAAVNASVEGRPGPTQDDNTAIWARWDAMTPAEQAAGFVTANGALIDRYESLVGDEDSISIDIGYLPFPLTLAQAARLRLSEQALHGWDVRVAADESASVSAQSAAALLHGEPSFLSYQAKTEALGGEHGIVQVTTSEPESVFTLDLGEKAEVRQAESPDADSTLVLPAEAWLRLVAGRLAPSRTPDGVVSTGPISLDKLRAVFPGY